MNPRPHVAFSPYIVYLREEWAGLRADTPMPLTEAELDNLSSLPERVSAEEVVDIWTFERDTRSRDPNWTLVETRTPS